MSDVRLWPGVRIEIVYNPDAEAAGAYTGARGTVVPPARPDPEDGPLVVLFDGHDGRVEMRRRWGFLVVGGEDHAEAWEDAVFNLPDPATYPHKYFRVPVRVPMDLSPGGLVCPVVELPIREFAKECIGYTDGRRQHWICGWRE